MGLVNVNVDYKQRWNKDKCWGESKELINKGICDKGLNWNPCNLECEYDKLYDGGEYLDYKNCKCRKRFVNKLVEECSENIDKKKLLSSEMMNVTLYECENAHNSCIIYILLFVISLIISTSISSVFIYFHWYLKRKYIKATAYWIWFHWIQFY